MLIVFLAFNDVLHVRVAFDESLPAPDLLLILLLQMSELEDHVLLASL